MAFRLEDADHAEGEVAHAHRLADRVGAHAEEGVGHGAADDRPVVWTRDLLPAARLEPRGLTADDLADRSVYESLSALFHIRVARGVAQLSPTIASAELAAALAVRRGTPLLRMAQTDYDANDLPVLYSLEYHLPDAFVFLVNRKGPHW